MVEVWLGLGTKANVPVKAVALSEPDVTGFTLELMDGPLRLIQTQKRALNVQGVNVLLFLAWKLSHRYNIKIIRI